MYYVLRSSIMFKLKSIVTYRMFNYKLSLKKEEGEEGEVTVVF